MPIKDPVALLNRLLAEAGESPWLEFKQNRLDPDEIACCISACANGAILHEKDRAFIVFGIENLTKRKVGTNVRLSEVRKGNENLQNWLSRMLTPAIMVETHDFQDGDLSFAILAIEPSYDRPVSFAGVEYLRIGENVKKLKEFPNHERSLWLATSRRKFEEATAAAHVNSREVLRLLNTDAYFSLARQPKPATGSQVLRTLSQCGFIREDMEGGYDVTNLGAVLFAKDIAEFPSVAMKSVRVVRYLGTDKRRSGTEVVGSFGYAIGFAGLIEYILKQVPGEERFDGGVRAWRAYHPEIAIREVIANALIHQDFTITGAGPIVEIYDDRIEVTNPGNSLIQIDRIIDERRSRNEKLASNMRALGICEERGGGIDKAILAIEDMSLPAPEFFPSENSMRVVMYGPRAFSKLSKADRVWACFCHCVVRWLKDDYMSNASLRARFSLADEDYQAVSSVIANAREEGRIVQAEANQGNKNAKYVPYWAR